jgi:hypothetical protein
MTITSTIFQELKPNAAIETNMFTVDAGFYGVQAQMLVVNQSNALVNSGELRPEYSRDCDYVRICITNAAVSTSAGYIAYDTLMPPNHVAQWQEINLSTGDNVFVTSEKGQCSFVFTGVGYS